MMLTLMTTTGMVTTPLCTVSIQWEHGDGDGDDDDREGDDNRSDDDDDGDDDDDILQRQVASATCTCARGRGGRWSRWRPVGGRGSKQVLHRS